MEETIHCEQCMKAIERDDDTGQSKPVSAFGLLLYDDTILWFCSVEPCAKNHPVFVKMVLREQEQDKLMEGLRRVNGARVTI